MTKIVEIGEIFPAKNAIQQHDQHAYKLVRAALKTSPCLSANIVGGFG